MNLLKNGLLAVAAMSFVGCASMHKDQSLADGSRAPAADKPKQGRDNLEYHTEGKNFYYTLPNGRKCQVTSGVEDFKMIPRGSHVTAYQTDSGELSMLRMGDDNAPDCYSLKQMKTVVTDQQAPVVKWNVVNASEVQTVVIALDRNGFVKMYDINGNEVSGMGIRNVQDYRLHPCHGKKGVPFNSKLAFAFGNGRVGTIDPAGKFVLDPGSYTSASDFIDRNKIDCSK